jgi:hypothetical protein
MSLGVLMAERTGSATIPSKELRCKRRACDTLLARVIGVTLVCLDGTRIGPVARGMVISRKCQRCGANNVFWL